MESSGTWRNSNLPPFRKGLPVILCTYACAVWVFEQPSVTGSCSVVLLCPAQLLSTFKKHFLVFNPSKGRCIPEIEESLVYRASSRKARVTHKNPVSKNQNPKTKPNQAKMKQTKTQSNQPNKMNSLLILLLSIEECLLFWSDCKFDILFVSFSPAAIPAKDEPWSPSSDLETHRRAAASCQSKRATEQMAPEYYLLCKTEYIS